MPKMQAIMLHSNIKTVSFLYKTKMISLAQGN